LNFEESIGKTILTYPPKELNLVLTPISEKLEFRIFEIWADVGGKTVFEEKTSFWSHECQWDFDGDEGQKDFSVNIICPGLF